MDQISTIILAGGKGLRLKKLIPNIAKPLVLILDKPFISYIIKQLIKQGVNDIIISVFNYVEQFEAYINLNPIEGANLYLIKEPFELGTGGAIAYCANKINSRYTLIMNGDTISNIDIQLMLNDHIKNNADISISVSYVKDVSRYGSVSFDEDNKLVSFNEKLEKGEGFVNNGYMIMNTIFLDNVSMKEPFSINSLISNNIGIKNIYTFINHNPFIDIGTPLDYIKAQTFILDNNLFCN